MGLLSQCLFISLVGDRRSLRITFCFVQQFLKNVSNIHLLNLLDIEKIVLRIRKDVETMENYFYM